MKILSWKYLLFVIVTFGLAALAGYSFGEVINAKAEGGDASYWLAGALPFFIWVLLCFIWIYRKLKDIQRRIERLHENLSKYSR